MFYGRFSRTTGRWLVVCPSPSSLLAAAIKIESDIIQIQKLDNAPASIPDTTNDEPIAEQVAVSH
jgi:hypothetical protein